MQLSSYIQTAKTAAAIILIVAVVWFYKDLKFQKAENIRQTENAKQLRESDSLRFSSQNLTRDEVKSYLQYQNPDLQKKLGNDHVNADRIQSIMTQLYSYKDDTKKLADLIRISKDSQSTDFVYQFADSTKCLKVKGVVTSKNDSLKVYITDREFHNKTDAVAYWERRQWRFLGLKTRFLGKKQFTAKVYDQCGESRVMKIEKKQE